MFSDLVGIGGGLLSYDFYLPQHNILCEIQGKQHEMPIEYFGGEEQFAIQQEHDRRKRNYAKEHNAKAIIRGLRVVSDFEYEWSYAAANEFINKDIEMVFLMAHKELTFISSSTIDELYRSGVDISSLVPSIVIEEYKKLEK